jgi:hypothetical protein
MMPDHPVRPDCDVTMSVSNDRSNDAALVQIERVTKSFGDKVAFPFDGPRAATGFKQISGLR